MIRDALKQIGTSYLAAKKEKFKEQPLGRFIRQEAPERIADAIGDPGLSYKGGCGIGRWAAVPWIGVFDPVITDHAQRGYYLVYLFSVDMRRVYLSMNQGTKEVAEEFGSGQDAIRELESRAALMRERLKEHRQEFGATKINLASKQFYARGYEAGHAFGRAYNVDALPSENALLADLQVAIRLYRSLILRGGGSMLSEEEAAEAGLENSSVEERRRYVAHRKIERNPNSAKLAKKAHGFSCQGCGFTFPPVYGDAGKGYIEAHHLKPLSEIPEGESVKLDPKKDFAVLCANCHRMVHRKGGPKTVAALRELPGVTYLRNWIASNSHGQE